MSVLDDLEKLLTAANDNEKPCDCERIRRGMFAGEHTRECAVFIWQAARAVARRTLKDNSAIPLAQALVESQEALGAWQAVDEHECEACDRHGYGDCLVSQGLTFTALLKQRAALRMDGLVEAMKEK